MRPLHPEKTDFARRCTSCVPGAKSDLPCAENLADPYRTASHYNLSLMSAPPIEKKIEALREKIRHHEYRYYVLDDPEISDADFAKLMNEIKRLEAENPELINRDSPTAR